MSLEELKALYARFTDMVEFAGDHEYIRINHIRAALAAYINDIEEYGEAHMREVGGNGLRKPHIPYGN